MLKSSYLKIGILIIIGNIVIAIGWWWFFNVINTEKDKILTTRTELETVENKINNLKHLESILEGVSEESLLVNNAFVDEKNIVSIIKKLEQVADISGVRLEVSGASLPKEKKDGGPNFILNVGGDFDEVYRFVTLLEKVSYQVLFDKIYIYKTDSKKEDAPPWQAQIEIRVLSYIF